MRGIDRSGDLLRPCHVERYDQRALAMRGGKLIERSGVTRGDDRAIAPREDAPSDRAAKSGGATGNAPDTVFPLDHELSPAIDVGEGRSGGDASPSDD